MSPFGVVCAKCGAGMPMGVAFCGSCGTRIEDEAAAPRQDAPPPRSPGARMLLVAWALGLVAGLFLGRAFAPGTSGGGEGGEPRPVVESQPQGAAEMLASARTASDAGRYAEARDLYRRALEMDPADLSALVDLGVAELALGDEAAGRSSFKGALAGSAPHPAAAYNLAKLAEDAGNKQEAEKYYGVYLKLAPEGPRAQDVRAKYPEKGGAR